MTAAPKLSTDKARPLRETRVQNPRQGHVDSDYAADEALDRLIASREAERAASLKK